MADDEDQLREIGPESTDQRVLVRKLKRIIAKQKDDIKKLAERLDAAGIP